MSKKVIRFTVQPPCAPASHKRPSSLHIILSDSLLEFYCISIEFDFQGSCFKETTGMFDFFSFSFLFCQDYIWKVNHYQKQTHPSMKTTAFLQMVKDHYFTLVLFSDKPVNTFLVQMLSFCFPESCNTSLHDSSSTPNCSISFEEMLTHSIPKPPWHGYVHGILPVMYLTLR